MNWHKVAGLWDDQQNVVEAERVVDLLKEAIDQDHQPTVGIVTFNRKQRDLVSNVVDARCERDPQFYEAWLRAENPPSGRLDDKPFVKNIENVQGDERDVIFLSMGYAPNESGRFLKNFGPLTKAGGERRLNVAITRAREEVVFVASVRSADMDLVGSHSESAHLLKAYLEYAERGVDSMARSVDSLAGECESLFEAEVAQALIDHGLNTVAQVGCGGFRIR